MSVVLGPEQDTGTNDAPDAASEGAPRFQSRQEFAAYAWFRIVETRRYWLLPVLALILVGSLVLNVFTGYNVLPAIYSLIP